MSPGRCLLFALAIPILTAIGFRPASAQITNVTDTTSTPTPGIGHDYIKFLSETVNPANGSVSLRISVPVPPARKLTIPFAFAYDSNGVNHLVGARSGGFGWLSNQGFISQGGWSYSLPHVSAVQASLIYPNPNPGQGGNLTCKFLSDYVFQDPSGRRDSLFISWLQDSNGQCTLAGLSNALNGGDGFYTAVVAPSGTSLQQPVYVADNDGTVYYFPGLPELYQPPFPLGDPVVSGLPAWVEDRNGNVSTLAHNPNGTFTVTDTAGRVAISAFGFGSSGNTVSVAGLANPYMLTWGTASASWSPSFQVLNPPVPSTCSVPAISATQSVVTAVALPNGQAYQFSYDPVYGLLNKIIYPTGGYVTYTWGVNALAETGQFTVQSNGLNGPLPWPCDFVYDTPVVAHRYVSFDGVNIALQQDFYYQTTPAASLRWTTKQTTVITKDCARNGFNCATAPATTTVYTYEPIDVPQQPNNNSIDTVQTPLERTVAYQDSNGVTLETVTKGWNLGVPGLDYPRPNPSLACELQTLDNGLISGTFSTYLQVTVSGASSSYLQATQILTDKKEFDFAQVSSLSCTDNATAPAGTIPARETVINYQTFGAGPLIPPASLATPTIIDRPCSIITYGSDGSRAAEADYLFDGNTGSPCSTMTPQAVTPVASLLMHDETNYFPASTWPRGNVTQVTRQCFQGGTQCSNAAGPYNATTTYTYDEAGQVASSIDPCGNASAACTDLVGTPAGATVNHTTQYLFADNLASSSGQTDAYLTGIINPLGQTVHFQYNTLNDGQLLGSTDANGQVTGYSYGDPLGRLTYTSFPDAGSARNAYNDAPYTLSGAIVVSQPTVTTTTAINSSQSLVTAVALDGLGQPVRQTVQSDPDCPAGASKDATYDGFGRVYTVSNPYCTTSDPTYGLTTYTYDALGRVISVATSDGATTTTSYSGNTTTVSDPASVTRKMQTDALGRLTAVWEDPNGANYPTFYTYDALDNLTSVQQSASRPRSFTYDSMSRLTSAVNPENGTVSYQYDANGNQFSRSGPAPNQTNPAVLLTVNFNYDALNRVVSKSYSDSTPQIQLAYDQNTLPGLTMTSTANGIGRLAVEGTFTAGGAVNLTSNTILGYDSMGRPSGQFQCFGSCTSFGWEILYYYDLIGNGSTTYYYDGSNLVLNQYFNSANRLTRIQSSASDSTHPQNLFNNAHYNAPGALLYVNRDSPGGIALADTAAFNSRLQLCRTSVNGSSTQLQTCADAVAPGNVLDLAYGFVGPAINPDPAAANNGSLTSMGASGVQAFSRTYSYDALNRLGSVVTSGTDCEFTWSYDAWGNRTDQTPTTTNPFCPAMHVAIDPNTNRLLGFGYDAAGNLTSDGLHSYYYDGENRLIQVDGSSFGDCATATACYQYDAEGRRVRKALATGSTIYVYDVNGRVIDEKDGVSGTNLAQYIYANGALFAEYKGCETYFTHGDHLGSTRLVTDSDGFVVDSLDYLPYGEQILGGTATTRKFTGLERDAETGLDHAWFRSYSASLGRWTSPDPLGGTMSDPQTLNRYAYVRNNPLAFVDPSGLRLVCEAIGDDPISCYDNGEPYVEDVDPGGQTPGSALGLDAGKATPIPSPKADDSDDVPADWKAQVVFQGHRQLWNNTATVVNATAIATGVIVAAPFAVEAAGAATGLAARGVGYAWALKGAAGVGVVLGRFPDYVNTARVMGANALNYPNWMYKWFDLFGVAWQANLTFINASINRGQTFFQSNPTFGQWGSWFEMELMEMASRGIPVYYVGRVGPPLPPSP